MPGQYARDEAVRLRRLADGRSETLEGRCVELAFDAGLAMVNVLGTEQLMPWVGPAPWVGDRVRVIYAGRHPVCCAVYGAAQGTLQSVAAGMATVLGDDGETYIYPIAAAIAALTSGARVAIDHQRRIIVAQYAAEPLGSAFETPPPPPAPSSKKWTFKPTESGNYRNGGYDGQLVEISISRSAHYWYGSQIKDSIADYDITKAVIRLKENWDNVPGTPSLMAYHGQTKRGGEPSLSAEDIAVSGSGEIDIMPFVAEFKSGAARGIGFKKNTGWRQFDTYARSGVIYMEGTR